MNYIPDRLDDQIQWYDKKSISFQKKYKIIAITTLVMSSLISLLTVLSLIFIKYNNLIVILSSIFSISVPILIGIEKIYKNYENYINYRRTCEELKREKIFYLNNIEPYNNENNLNLLIKRCESIMAHESGIWAQINEKKSD